MDASETFDRSNIKDNKPTHLFPVSIPSESSGNVATLFPVVDSVSESAYKPPLEDNPLDWLENKSYGDKAQASVIELQQAISEYEAGQNIPKSDSEEDVSSNEDTPTAASNIQASRPKGEPVSSEKAEKRKKKSSKHKHKHKKHKSKKYVTDKEIEEKPQLSEKFTINTKKIFLEEMSGLEPEHAFRLDRKRDKELWTYKSLYKAHVASYRRHGQSALGVVGYADLFKHERTNKRPEPLRYCQKRNKSLLKRAGLTVKPKSVDVRVEYIPLNNQEVEEDASDPFMLMDEATRLYIKGKGLNEGESEEITSFDDEMLQKVASFNKRLRESPKDVDLWLDFVKFQDRVFNSEDSTELSNRLRTAQALIDKKLSILSRALSENPGCLDLQLAQLEVSGDMWDSERLDKEWDQLLFVHSANVKLWRKYILHQQSKLASFSVSKMVKVYHKCFQILTSVMEGKVKTARATEDLPNAVLEIFHQYCTFLRQVGQTERAVASYQAQIEFNIFCPPSLQNMDFKDSAAVFESFWDSSVPRFGEEGALGWARRSQEKTLQGVSASVQDKTEEAEEEILSKELPKWNTWLQIEKLREDAHWLPWRPDLSKNETEEDCEDVERLVLVDDVMPVLFSLPAESCWFKLVLGFLQLLGLDAQDVLSDLCLHLTEADGHFLQMLLDKLYQLPAAAELGSAAVDSQWKIVSPLQCFITGILKQAVRCFKGHHQTVFTLLHIKFECLRCRRPLKDLPKDKKKELKKFMKNLLKESHNRSNLTAWNEYTWLENDLGKTTDAIGVAETALAMFSGSGCEDKAGLCLLYLTYCQLLLGFNHKLHINLNHKQKAVAESIATRVMLCLSSLADESKFKSEKASHAPVSLVLKSRRKFGALMSQLISTLANDPNSDAQGDITRHLLSVLNCLAMFDLVSSDLDTALSHYTKALASIENSPQTLSLLKYNIHKSELLLIQNHMACSVVPLSKFRASLDKALAEFPDSSEFLKCLVDIENKSHIVGRLRRYVDRGLMSPSSPVLLVVGVLAELNRLRTLQGEDLQERQYSSGIIHRVRRLVERGSHIAVTQHCPLVWRLFCHVESQFGDTSRVKGVLYRSLQQCPWAKVLYMDGVELLGKTQLQELVDLMTEKELRVQIPVEELELLAQSEPAPGPEMDEAADEGTDQE